VDIPVGDVVAVVVELLEVVANIDEEEAEAEPDVVELLVVVAEVDVPDFDDVRVVNGTVLIFAKFPRWKRLCPEQQAVPVVVSQQYLPADSGVHIAMLLEPTA
jgi:hypothetical protein